MSEKVRIGFVGTGQMGQLAHLTNYIRLADCEVVALAEPRRKVAEEVAKRYGVKEVYKDHHELLKNADVDAIVASQRFSHHINLVPDILKAKKAILTEKPIAVAPESGEALAKLAKENNVPYMIGYHKRSDPAVEYAKRVIDEWKTSGEYGKMRFVRITMPPGNWTNRSSAEAWNSEIISSDEPYPLLELEAAPAYLSQERGKEYISFVNYYIHQVNAMRLLLGEPYKVTYVEKTGAILVVESLSGICGTLEMAPYSRSNDWEEAFFVGFERGYVKIELPAPVATNLPGVVTIYRDNGKGEPTITQPILPRISAMQKQAINFISAVKGEREVTCGPEEATEDLKIAMAYIRMKYSL